MRQVSVVTVAAVGAVIGVLAVLGGMWAGFVPSRREDAVILAALVVFALYAALQDWLYRVMKDHLADVTARLDRLLERHQALIRVRENAPHN